MNIVHEDKHLTPNKKSNEAIVADNQGETAQNAGRTAKSAPRAKEESPDTLVTSKVTSPIIPSEGIETEVFAPKADDTSSPIEFSTSENRSVPENSKVNPVADDHRVNEGLKTPVDTKNLQELDKPRNFKPTDAFTITDKTNSIEPGNEELSKKTPFSESADAKKDISVQDQSRSADIDLTSSHETEPSSASPRKTKSTAYSGRAPNDPREVRKRELEANQSGKDQ